MPVLEKLTKHKHAPIALIFKGAHALGVELAGLLIDQGAFVILIDDYSQSKKRRVGQLLEKELFTFMDISGSGSLADSIEKLDYIFYLNHKTEDPEEEVPTSEFLERSNSLDRLLQLGVEKKSKFLLTSSMRVHQILQAKQSVPSDIGLDDSDLSYTVLEVQRYAENLTWEYYKKAGLDARIVRIGEILGEGIDLKRDSLVSQYIKNAINGRKIIVEGDGLENLYFVHVLDAAYGLIKAEFTSKTSGNIYSLVIPRDITVLNLAYKILDLEPRAGGIDFVDEKKSGGVEIYKPAVNLKKIGWKPKVSFERALAQTINYAYKIFGGKRVDKKRERRGIPKDIKVKTKEGKSKKQWSLKDFLVNFFFEVKEEQRPKSVLDSAQFSSYKSPTLKEGVKPKLADRVHLTEQKKPKGKYKRSKLKVIGWKIADFFNGIRKAFRSLSLAGLAGYLLVFGLVVVIYIFFFVPLLRIIYYGGVVYIRTNSATAAFEDWQFSQASSDLNRVYSSLVEVDKSLDRVSYLSGFLGKVEEFRDDIGNVKQALKGSQIIAQTLVPVEAYIESYESNIELEGVDDLISHEGKSYSLESLGGVEAELSRAEQILNTVDRSVYTKEIDLPLVGKRIESLLKELETIQNQSEGVIDVIRILPSLLASREAETTAVLLLDDQNINTKGGEITALCVFTLDGGKVTQISVYSAEELQVTLASEQERLVRDDLKLLYPEQGLSFKDLTLLIDDREFTTLLKDSISSEFGKSPDSILTINFVALEDIIALIGGIDLEGGKALNSINFEENIVSDDISYKEILSKVMKRLFEYQKADISTFVLFLEKHLKLKNLDVYSEDSNLNNFLEDKEILIQENSECFDGLEMALISHSSYKPMISVESETELVDSKVSEVEYLIEFEQGAEDEFSGSGLFRFGSNFEILDINTSSPQVELASSYADKVFINLDLDTNSKEQLVVKGRSENIVLNEGTGYNYKVKLVKPSGFNYNYTFILDYGSDLNLVSYPDGGIWLDTTVKLEGILTKDFLGEFNFSL